MGMETKRKTYQPVAVKARKRPLFSKKQFKEIERILKPVKGCNINIREEITQASKWYLAYKKKRLTDPAVHK